VVVDIHIGPITVCGCDHYTHLYIPHHDSPRMGCPTIWLFGYTFWITHYGHSPTTGGVSLFHNGHSTLFYTDVFSSLILVGQILPVPVKFTHGQLRLPVYMLYSPPHVHRYLFLRFTGLRTFVHHAIDSLMPHTVVHTFPRWCSVTFVPPLPTRSGYTLGERWF